MYGDISNDNHLKKVTIIINRKMLNIVNITIPKVL